MNTNSERKNGNGKGVEHSTAVPMHSFQEDHRLKPNKKAVKYMQCLKNHAAAIGGHAVDGCGEFMPGGEEGTIEALKCSACNCHRNFHKKMIEEGECSAQDYRFFFLHNAENHLTSGHDQVTMSTHQVQLQTSDKDEQEEEEAEIRPHEVGRKRYRTKFSKEQKEQMWSFAEKIGWKVQKTDDSTVNHFCQEIGIRSRVLKVWMHNNKNNLAKKSTSQS